jgi:hypothetical protein
VISQYQSTTFFDDHKPCKERETLNRMSSFVECADRPYSVTKGTFFTTPPATSVRQVQRASQGYIAENAPLWYCRPSQIRMGVDIWPELSRCANVIFGKVLKIVRLVNVGVAS